MLRCVPFLLHWLVRAVLAGAAVAALPAAAQSFAWDAQALPTNALGTYLQVLREYGEPWTVQQAQQRFAESNPPPPRQEVLSFGIGAPPVWLRLPLHNAESEPVRLHLLLGTTWLDHADVYLLRHDQVYRHIQLGDESPYAYGVVPGFGFGWPLDLPPQHTTLLVRVQSLDPLVLPVQLLDAAALAAQRDTVQYSYELMFGTLFALMLYNFTLYAVARNPLHARYGLYLASMLAMCVAYTGKGLDSWWPQNPGFQRYAILCCMVLFNMAGLTFATHFLRLRALHPRVGRALLAAQGATVACMAALVLADHHLAAVWWAFASFLVCTLLLFGMGAWAAWARVPQGRWFFAAVGISMAGAALAWLAVVGVVGYSTWALRAMELGFVVDALVLAFALGQRIESDRLDKAARALV